MSTSISQSQKKPRKGTCAPNNKECDPTRPNNPPETLLQSNQHLYKHPILNKKDMFITIYSPKNTMYTHQTGKLTHSSSRGYNYQMTIHEIDGASTWVEVMKNITEGEMIEA